MNLDIPKDQLEKIVSAAILAAVTPENRDTLITKAIATLLEPEKNSYGQSRSTPLQQAFDWALNVTAKEIIREQCASNGMLRSQIQKLVLDAMNKVFTDEKYPGVVDALAESISHSMTYKVER